MAPATALAARSAFVSLHPSTDWTGRQPGRLRLVEGSFRISWSCSSGRTHWPPSRAISRLAAQLAEPPTTSRRMVLTARTSRSPAARPWHWRLLVRQRPRQRRCAHHWPRSAGAADVPTGHCRSTCSATRRRRLTLPRTELLPAQCCRHSSSEAITRGTAVALAVSEVGYWCTKLGVRLRLLRSVVLNALMAAIFFGVPARAVQALFERGYHRRVHCRRRRGLRGDRP